MNTFEVGIVAVDRVCFQGSAVECRVRTTGGWRTFEAHHEPFLAVVRPSTVTVVEENGGTRAIAVGGGLLRFSGNTCVLTVALGPSS